MLFEAEIVALFRNHKSHWSIKARIIHNYMEQNPEVNRDQAAWKFYTTEKIISEYLHLAQNLKYFPALAKIPSKQEALQILQRTDNHIELRQIIQVAALKYKSQLQLKELKDGITKIKSDIKLKDSGTRSKKSNYSD